MIQCLFSDHNGTKLKISSTKVARTYQDTYRLNNMFLNGAWIKEKNLRRNLKIFLTNWKWKHNLSKFVAWSKNRA